MRCSDEYLGIKKIVAMEAIAEIILKNKECWDADLESLVNNNASIVISKIEKVLGSGKEDKLMINEIREILQKYGVSDRK